MLNSRPMSKDELSEFLSSGESSTMEHFKASIEEGFDNTSIGVAFDYLKETFADTSSKRASKTQAQENINAFYDGRTPNVVDPESPQLKSFTEEDWRKSEHFREGVKFQEGWSEERAKYLAEGFDEKQERALILKNDDGMISKKSAIGFVGQMIGSLPDPINFIPFGGAASKGAKAGEKVLRASIEGAVGNLAVAGIARPYWERQGVDSDWTDYTSDFWLGGVMGGLFGAAGHAFSKRLSKHDIPLEHKVKIGEAADSAIDAIATGKDLDLTKIEGLQKTFDSVFEMPEVQRSRKVQDLTDQLTEMGYAPDEARSHITPIVAQAEAFARDFDMSIDDFLAEYGPTFQSSEIIGQGSARRISRRATSEIDIEINQILDSEIQNMRMEIDHAQAGEKIFVDGEFKGNAESTFPQWFRDAGFKSKEEFYKAIDNKTTAFDKVKELADGRLRAMNDPEYSALTGHGMDDIPTGADGEPLFKKSGGKERGAITFEQDGKAIIHLFENADRSTIIHETGHLFLNNLEKFSAMEKASPQLKADFDNIKAWMGVEPGGKIETKHHEKFARGFEQFLREGKAPRPELQGVFSRFKDWLTSIYKSSKDLKANLSDEARDVYSRLLGAESRPRIDATPEAVNIEPRFKSEADIDAKTSEIQAMVETDARLATPDETAAFTESIAEIELETMAMDEALAFFQGARDEKTLQELAQKVGISKSHFERIVDDFNQKLLDEDNARLGIEKLIEQKKVELAVEAAELKRQAYLALGARTEVLSHVDKIIESGAAPERAILSILEGDSTLRGIEGAGKSVDGSYMALAQSTSSKAFTELRKIDPRIEKLFENDMQFNGNVIKEMVNPGSSGDDMARQAGEILSRYSEELRQRANLAGAKIGKLEGHTPRSHDVEKMIGKEDEWISFMLENLDSERTFKGLNEGGKREALLEIYASFVSDNHGSPEIEITEPLRRVPRNIAKKMGESRSLHFKSADAELAYLKQFGQGDNILQTMSSHYESMSRKIALMERLGPNPENTIAHTIQTVHDRIKQQIIDKKITAKEGNAIIEKMGTVGRLKSRDSNIGRAMMMALGEGSGEQHWFKSAGQIIRAVNSLSKLGSALLSQPTDFIHALNERRILTGKNEASLWVETLSDYFSNPSPQMLEIIDHMGIFVDSMNYKNFNRFEVDNVNNKLARANDWMFRISGQNWHVKHQKQAAGISLAREMGANITKAWNDIHPGLRETLVQYGSFNEAKWNKIQKVGAMDVDGKPYFHPGLLAELGDEVFEDMIPPELQNISRPQDLIEMDSPDAKSWEAKRASELKRARYKLEMDLKTFFVEESRNAAPEPDAKVRRIMSFGTKQGTATNEAMKLLTQFKTFAFVNWDRSIKGKRMMKDPKDYGGLAHHAVATLALGYFSTVLKDLAKGQTPADPTLGATWGRAAAQSGGLGIMGDFFATGVSSRSGADFVSSMAGPTFSTVGNFANLAGQTLRGDVLDDGSKVTSKWINFGRSLAPAPVSSLWFTRAAMDHLVWQNLKETLEPGSIRRSQRRLKKELNQKYIVSPQDTLWLPNATR